MANNINTIDNFKVFEKFDTIDNFKVFENFRRVAMDDLTLLDATIFRGRAVDKALKDKTATLERSINHLSILPAHDALCLLKNSLAIPKLLYILWTSLCADNPLPDEFDLVLKTGLKKILNAQLSGNH